MLKKTEPLHGRGVISTTICAAKERNGPASANKALSTGNPDSHHAHGVFATLPLSHPFWLRKPGPKLLYEYMWVIIIAECISKVFTTLIRPDKKKSQLVHSLSPALTLTLTLTQTQTINHLANKPQQTTSGL